jgi:hypothetical protein
MEGARAYGYSWLDCSHAPLNLTVPPRSFFRALSALGAVFTKRFFEQFDIYWFG